jgi:hypothetical protein
MEELKFVKFFDLFIIADNVDNCDALGSEPFRTFSLTLEVFLSGQTSVLHCDKICIYYKFRTLLYLKKLGNVRIKEQLPGFDL